MYSIQYKNLSGPINSWQWWRSLLSLRSFKWRKSESTDQPIFNTCRNTWASSAKHSKPWIYCIRHYTQDFIRYMYLLLGHPSHPSKSIACIIHIYSSCMREWTLSMCSSVWHGIIILDTWDTWYQAHFIFRWPNFPAFDTKPWLLSRTWFGFQKTPAVSRLSPRLRWPSWEEPTAFQSWSWLFSLWTWITFGWEVTADIFTCQVAPLHALVDQSEMLFDWKHSPESETI